MNLTELKHREEMLKYIKSKFNAVPYMYNNSKTEVICSSKLGNIIVNLDSLESRTTTSQENKNYWRLK